MTDHESETECRRRVVRTDAAERLLWALSHYIDISQALTAMERSRDRLWFQICVRRHTDYDQHNLRCLQSKLSQLPQALGWRFERTHSTDIIDYYEFSVPDHSGKIEQIGNSMLKSPGRMGWGLPGEAIKRAGITWETFQSAKDAIPYGACTCLGCARRRMQSNPEYRWAVNLPIGRVTYEHIEHLLEQDGALEDWRTLVRFNRSVSLSISASQPRLDADLPHDPPDAILQAIANLKKRVLYDGVWMSTLLIKPGCRDIYDHKLVAWGTGELQIEMGSRT